MTGDARVRDAFVVDGGDGGRPTEGAAVTLELEDASRGFRNMSIAEGVSRHFRRVLPEARCGGWN